MVRLSRLLKCRLLLLIPLIFGIYLLYISQTINNKKCTQQDSIDMVQDVCDLYESNKIDGNLCNDLCNSNKFQYETCFNRFGGKKVIQAQLGNRRVVLKSRHAKITDYDPIYKGALDDDSGSLDQRFMSQESFRLFVFNHVQSVFGIKLDLTNDQVLDRLLSQSKRSSRILDKSQMNSLWTLLQQDEYTFFMFFQGTSYFPKIYGACGHFYVEEYVPPGVIYRSDAQSLSQRIESASWERRVKVAKDLLDIVKGTESDFRETLHLCDVKPENFGIVDFQVKAVDIDISFFDTVMGNFLEQPKCSEHKDCDFFDCHGVCDVATEKCTRQRKNNNFQAICADVFQQTLGNPGLLRHPPARIEEELKTLLNRCIFPTEAEQVAKGSSTETFRSFYNLLTESLILGDR
ncbi:divergent protein kinase domain 1C-like [Asterias rubens]|uniref:divergent protein kinase domain 1C-like n=1 Tax=Asterias rubens TaxID=7604 RepID=UPI0014550ADD|nr:divergent protein kinase domain 1C-like [Asterias rubens]XP_033625503.1 divergent protein kinase domain 1C-like [Asterias rubens]